jgi:hypothetical protein
MRRSGFNHSPYPDRMNPETNALGLAYGFNYSPYSDRMNLVVSTFCSVSLMN